MRKVDVTKCAAADALENGEIRPGARYGYRVLDRMQRRLVALRPGKARDTFELPQCLDEWLGFGRHLRGKAFPLDERSVADRPRRRRQHLGTFRHVCLAPFHRPAS